MKLITGILAVAVAMMTGAAFGQNPDAIDNARSVAKSLQQIKTNETNAALAATGAPAPQAENPAAKSPAKPATGQPAAKTARQKPAAARRGEKRSAKAAKGRKAARCLTPKKPKAVASAKVAAPKSEEKSAATSKVAANEKPADPGKSEEADKAPKPEDKKWAMTGKRDPFFSPVTQQTTTVRMLDGKEMPGDWADQCAGRGEVRERLHRGSDQ